MVSFFNDMVKIKSRRAKISGMPTYLVILLTFMSTNLALAQLSKPNYSLIDSLINAKHFSVEMYCINSEAAFYGFYETLSPELFMHRALSNDKLLSACNITIDDKMILRMIVLQEDASGREILQYNKNSYMPIPTFNTQFMIAVKCMGQAINIISVSRDGLFLRGGHLVPPNKAIWKYIRDKCESCR
jgi:hypothetical protein